MKFRKKPVVIDAVQCVNDMGGDVWYSLPEWLRAAYEDGNILFLSDSVEIKTLEGTMKASIGDWIIQGVKGEIYPCKPEIFEATYEMVEQWPPEE